MNFRIARQFVDAKQFVFLDESGAQTNMTRRYGWALSAQRCHDAAPHGHWKTSTLISAIGYQGVLPSATLLLDGTINAATFDGYVRRCLCPALRPGQIVVMDNLAAHKVTGIRQAIESAGCDLWYLPAYSPDLNPIEKMWSKIKAWLRRAAARSIEQLHQAVAEAFGRVTVDECHAYFKSCGYATLE